MRWTKTFVGTALVAPLLMLGCAKEPAPESAPLPDIAAAAPAGVQVHEFTTDDWKGPVCTGDTVWTLQVPPGPWIAMPVGWYAVDEATARANWEHMSYRIWEGDRELAIPEGLQIQVDSLNIQCPDRTITGVAVSPVVYLPPVTNERQYRFQLLFNADVNDGWNTFAEGTDISNTVILRATG